MTIISRRRELRRIRTPHMTIAACYVMAAAYATIQEVAGLTNYAVVPGKIKSPAKPKKPPLD